jgi:hypothetical protein
MGPGGAPRARRASPTSENPGMNNRSTKGKTSAATMKNSDLAIDLIIPAGRVGINPFDSERIKDPLNFPPFWRIFG